MSASQSPMARLNRRRFLQAASGLFIPATFGIARAQMVLSGPIMRPIAAASGGGSITIQTSQTGTGSTSAAAALTGVTAGALLIATCSCELAADWEGSIAGGSLTWTPRHSESGADADSGQAAIYTAPFAAGGNITVTATVETNMKVGIAVYAVTGQHASPIGNLGTAFAQSEPSIALTTTSATSAVFCVVSDWSAVDDDRTYRTPPTHTESLYNYQTGRYTGIHFFIADAGTAAAKTLGMTTPTGQASNCFALEIKPA